MFKRDEREGTERERDLSESIRSFLNPRFGLFVFWANGGLEGGTVFLAVNWRLCDSIRGGTGVRV